MGDLMAQVDGARKRQEESNQQLLAASGAMKGVAAAAWIENRRLRTLRISPPLPPLPSLEERLRQTRASSSPRDPLARFAAGRANERAWDEHLRHRAAAEGGRATRQVSWKDSATGRNATFPGARSRRLDNAYEHPNGQVDVLEHKLSPLTSSTSEARTQQARDQIAMNRGLEIGNNKEGFRSPVNNVVYTEGLPVHGPGGNTALPGDGERNTHVHIEPQDGRAASQQGNRFLRGAGRALGPLSFALDAYTLTEAWNADGGQWGENTTSAVGGVAGGWGGAAVGAAVGATFGSAVPLVGTAIGGVVGGVIGGVIGSGVGSEIADEVGDVAEEIGEGIGDVVEGIRDIF